MTMQQEIYEAIKTEWEKSTYDEQRTLIYRYIQGDSSGLRGSWMEFLHIQFGLQYRQTFPKNRTTFDQHSL